MYFALWLWGDSTGKQMKCSWQENGRHVRDKRLEELSTTRLPFPSYHCWDDIVSARENALRQPSSHLCTRFFAHLFFKLTKVGSSRSRTSWEFYLVTGRFSGHYFFLSFTRANQQRVMYERSESVWRLYFVCRKISKWKTVASGYENSKKKYRGKWCGRIGPHTRQEQPVATGGYTLHHILQYS